MAPSTYNGHSPGRYLIDTKGCRIPDLRLYDKSIVSFIFEEKPVVCDKDGRGMLVNYIGNKLYVNMTLLPVYGLTEETLDCCYEAFTMIPLTDEDVKKLKRPLMRYDECIRFTAVDIKDEFVKVTCWLPDYKIYEDVFVFVQEEKYNSSREDDKLSVLVIGFDSVSRLNFHRQMPKTVKFLKEQNAVEMFGYNKVADNTYPNVAPVLTGLSVDELENLCTPMEYKTFDNCPLIWKKYKSQGFTTGYGEDLGLNGIFITLGNKFRRHGFKNPPTNFFLNPLTIAGMPGNYNVCLKKRVVFEIFIDAIKQFAVKLRNLKTFGFFWTLSLSHERINLLRNADDYFYNFLKTLLEHDVLNKSILILQSDHGIRLEEIRDTHQGYLEDKLPFLFFMYPSWFPNKYPKAVENLKANSRRLISAFDFHKTLLDLIGLKNISNSALDNRFHDKSSTIGTSLFLPINESRTCEDAGIPKVYCVCGPWVESLNISDSKVIESSVRIVAFINKLLMDYKQCRRLYLHEIARAELKKRLLLQSTVTNFGIVEYYLVTLKTGPNMARFEGTVRYNTLTKSFVVLAPVSRINRYGNESYCVDSSFLKNYCFCKF